MNEPYSSTSNPQNSEAAHAPQSGVSQPSKRLSLPRGDKDSGNKKKLSLTLSQKSHDVIENYVESYHHRSASDALDAILLWIAENVDPSLGKTRGPSTRKARGPRGRKPQDESSAES